MRIVRFPTKRYGTCMAGHHIETWSSRAWDKWWAEHSNCDGVEA